MSQRSARGAKLKCQNEECAATFYDLNRSEFACPICGAEFDQDAHAMELKQQREAPAGYTPRKQPRVLPIIAPDDPEETANDGDDVVETEASEDVEATETAPESTDVLLEEDTDDGDALTDAVPLTVADEEEQ